MAALTVETLSHKGVDMVHSGSDDSNEQVKSGSTGQALPAQWAPPSVGTRLERGVHPATWSEVQPQQNLPAYYSHPTPQFQQGVLPAQQVHMSPTQIMNVNVNSPIMPMIVTAPASPPLIARVFWYIFVGWWLSAVLIVLAYVLMVTIIGIPVAFALFNRIPQALTLRARTVQYGVQVRDGVTYLTTSTEQQRPWYLRALYFVLIGWWFGAVWLVAAWLIGVFIITLPITFLMYNRTSAVMTLQRH